MSAARTFDCDPSSIAEARAFVRDSLGGQSERLLDRAELLVSEIATNCVTHARSEFEVAVHRGAVIRVEVRDLDRRMPALGSPSPDDTSGRGLLMVEAVASAWGVTPGEDGKSVWFELDADPQPGD